MTDQQEHFPPRSLAWHFEAPDGFRGEFGWMCGYSADPHFMNDAVERFLRWTKSQRARAGEVRLALMLDPGNPQIAPADVPGVIHVGMRAQQKPFHLLHAKVAVLGFRDESMGDDWIVRLIVATGNWTDGTLEQSLDLVWTVDVASADLVHGGEDVSQACADVAAGWNLLDWLRAHFDTRPLTVVPDGRRETATTIAMQRFNSWMDRVASHGKHVTPRLADNRTQSLLQQLPGLVARAVGATRRNYLGMGSGFFEGGGASTQIPSVLQSIVQSLYNEGQVTSSPEVDVFVNPTACQAVAGAFDAFKQQDWSVRPASRPSFYGEGERSLHAKFIFSANSRDNSDRCNSPWLYLGSGNLTHQGFTEAISPRGGNLEAGVVFDPGELYWASSRSRPPTRWVGNRLPVQWQSIVDDPAGLSAGSEMAERPGDYFAPPVSCMAWADCEGGGWLKPLGDEGNDSFNLLHTDGQPLSRDEDKGFNWTGPRPRQVRICWMVGGESVEADIPVMDAFGRVAAAALPAIDVEEAWWQLAEFPSPPDDEGTAPDGDQETSGVDSDPASMRPESGSSYPVRQMMELIERVADKQTRLSQADWIAWCTRLEQCLSQAAGADVVRYMREMGLNPLSPLWQAPFRPDFALDGATPDGLRYEGVLERVEHVWQVAGFAPIGETA